MTTLSLTERIQGRSQIRILREFVTNSAVFPIFDAIRSITTDGAAIYFARLPHYLMFLSAIVQAWYLGRKRNPTWWEHALGNLIAPTIYTFVDVWLEGPAAFFAEPYHWVFWAFSLGTALLYLAQSLAFDSKPIVTILLNLWRVLLFPTLYALSELSGELSDTLTGHAFRVYWLSSSGHQFILLGALLFGLLLGLSEAQRNRYTASLQRVAHQLKQFSEWSMGIDLLEESMEDTAVLRQRRVERTILFIDIRGFTSWSESRSPETVVSMLNEFYELAESIILTGGGHKPHFIGDEVMTWFADPLQAVSVGQHLGHEANKLLQEYGLAAGVGIHTGEVVEGLMGSSKTRSYNLIGDAVNTASRLTAAAAPGEVLVSENVARWLATPPSPNQARTIQAKGKREPVQVYPIFLFRSE